MKFKIVSDYQPTGDQPQAIDSIVSAINSGEHQQTLLGVTGSGKTFTMANVIANINRPAIVLSHNKTLAAQLYGEFKNYFPENAVEYFVSYYDYYQPEAFIPSSNLYIEKDMSINEEIEKLRLSTTSTLMSGRRDVIVVASVSCIYGLGNPEQFGKNKIMLTVKQVISRRKFLFQLTEILYSRTEGDFKRGLFRVKGDIVDVFLAYADYAVRIHFYGDEIEAIQHINPTTRKKICNIDQTVIFPANVFVTGKDLLHQAIAEIGNDLFIQHKMFEETERPIEASRIQERTTLDLEMMRELGYCSGIENYSRYFDQREQGKRPFCLLDYFPKDFITFIDESHVTIPQLRAMWGGDRSRKINLVEHGFRLPAAMDNRPLTFNEFESIIGQTIYVSATPSKYEIQNSEGVIVEQLIRPTGLLDPIIEVKPSNNQIDDLLEQIDERVKKNERVLVTTITKRMAEELAKFMGKVDVKCRYIHSEIDTLERINIIQQLRSGVFDVLVGVNLLREGIDLPEVSLVAILDADKQGFLRNERSLVQIIGRAARNENGKAFMYADTITPDMQTAIEENNRRRKIQMDYNLANHITPKTINKSKINIFEHAQGDISKSNPKQYKIDNTEQIMAADPVISYMSKKELEILSNRTKTKMRKAAKKLDFMEAAQLRDEYKALEHLIAQKK